MFANEWGHINRGVFLCDWGDFMRRKILIVDDTDMNRDLLSEVFEKDYEILEATNGDDALDILNKEKENIAVVLLDLVMPTTNGQEVLSVMNRSGMLDDIPVIIVSSDQSTASEKECLKNGAYDFIHKPFDDLIVKTRVTNAINQYWYKRGLEEKVANQFEEINDKNELLKKQNNILKKQSEKLKKNNASIIDVLGNVVESRSMESGKHVQRVKYYTKIMAEEMMKRFPKYGLTKMMVEIITDASALHDIGKIAIPDHILLKPGRLTDDEFEEMKSHTTRGCELFEQIKGIWDSRYNKVSYEICRYHHERYDGRGYPEGLSGDEIPISAQIVSVADVYDALTHKRCYKDAFPQEVAFEMIVNGECGTFSPELMECFVNVKDKMSKVEENL